MATTTTPPPLSIPASTATVTLSIIDTGARISNVPASLLLSPPSPALSKIHNQPSWSFLVAHAPSARTYLFDLGIRKDWATAVPPGPRGFIKWAGCRVDAEHNVADVLVRHGMDLRAVSGVIWSHWHWDHTGEVAAFPPETELLVGPGFRDAFVTPGAWPTKEDGAVDEGAWAGRTLREFDFAAESKGLVVAGYDAIDFFGDGSFYILDAPGHTIDHISALARVTPDSFVLLGADTCHHPGAYRPSSYAAMPTDLTPDPLLPPSAVPSSCCSALFAPFHPAGRLDAEPFFTLSTAPDGGVNHSRARAMLTRDKLMRLDAADNVLVVIAHDPSVLGVVDFYPGTLNAWKEQGLKERCKWRFLADFKEPGPLKGDGEAGGEKEG